MECAGLNVYVFANGCFSSSSASVCVTKRVHLLLRAHKCLSYLGNESVNRKFILQTSLHYLLGIKRSHAVPHGSVPAKPPPALSQLAEVQLSEREFSPKEFVNMEIGLQ